MGENSGIPLCAPCCYPRITWTLEGPPQKPRCMRICTVGTRYTLGVEGYHHGKGIAVQSSLLYSVGWKGSWSLTLLGPWEGSG